jgi:hypothetical protein
MDKSAAAAAQRANDFNNSFMGMPGYADDSMFFVLRYGHQAETTMSKAEYQGFMADVHEYNKAVLHPDQTPAEGEGFQDSVAARSQNLKELREKALAWVKSYPSLERDFDRFTQSARATFKAMNKS